MPAVIVRVPVTLEEAKALEKKDTKQGRKVRFR